MQINVSLLKVVTVSTNLCGIRRFTRNLQLVVEGYAWLVNSTTMRSMQFDYEQYAEMIGRVGADVSASESHGILCGLLCSGKCSDVRKVWSEQLLSEKYQSSNSTVVEFDANNDLVHQETIRQINHETLNFSLLLPSENESLEVRTEALADWCQGFNYGLAIGGFKQTAQTPEDVIELIRDFNEIAKAGFAKDDADEEEEVALFEIEEYVRVGVLLIMEELNPVKQQKPVLH